MRIMVSTTAVVPKPTHDPQLNWSRTAVTQLLLTGVPQKNEAGAPTLAAGAWAACGTVAGSGVPGGGVTPSRARCCAGESTDMLVTPASQGSPAAASS